MNLTHARLEEDDLISFEVWLDNDVDEDEEGSVATMNFRIHALPAEDAFWKVRGDKRRFANIIVEVLEKS